MGHSPWGGSSAVIRPDGSIQASRTYEKDSLVAEEIDISKATRTEAERRRNHPIFKPFWDMGEKLLQGQIVRSTGEMTPYCSAARNIKIAATQMACSRDMSDNVSKIKDHIRKAADRAADIVVFPELAVTGHSKEDISAISQSALDDALSQIRDEADSANVYVIVGMPYFVDGHRNNCAFVIGDDGSIKTRYAQLVTKPGSLFRAGMSTKAMWFELKGVHAIVTIGDDANWVEIAELAASRGMYLHFHITYEACSSADEATLRKQRNLLMLRYAKYGAVVNPAAATGTSNPSAPACGMSMIVSREGGHNKPAPSGFEYYLPYQTSIVKSAGSAETMLVATRKTSARNDMDLTRYWRNRNRRNRVQSGWYEWMKKGASLMEKDTYGATPASQLSQNSCKSSAVTSPSPVKSAPLHQAGDVQPASSQ
jgi:predicted amidohydrolase